MHVFKLKFLSALHVDSKGSGEPEIADEFIRSDTLSAAMAISWSALFPDEANSDFFLEPPYRISSAFPYIGNVLLFPIPVWRIWKKVEIEKRKAIKDVRWISRNLFEKVLSGNEVDFQGIATLPGGVALSHEEYNANPNLKNYTGWAKSERQRVRVDRLNVQNEGGLFFFALQFFAKDSGLYLIANMDKTKLEYFRASLAFLGDAGIGADRSSGLGHFSIREESDLQFTLPKKSDGSAILSLFNPGKDDNLEVLSKVTAYGLTTRSGWIANSTLGRPPIRAFTEGSYFSGKPKGRVVEMLPADIREKNKLPINHSAPRDFRALFFPCVQPPYLKENSL
jgi:CRISPR type III-A-associated RAMP protein Csm4